MSEREFLFEKRTLDGRPVNGFRIECGASGCRGTHFMPANGKRLPHTAAAQHFRNQGWIVGKAARQDRCPSCNPKHRAKSKVLNMEDFKADKPREMTRADKRKILEKLQETYLDETQGYIAPWTDKRVADDLCVPPAWVADLRDDLFGPAHSNAEFDDFLEEAIPLIDEARGLLKNAAAQLDQAREIGNRIDALERTARKIERDIDAGGKKRAAK